MFPSGETIGIEQLVTNYIWHNMRFYFTVIEVRNIHISTIDIYRKSIHPLSSTYTIQSCCEGWTYPSCHGARDGVHPGQVATLIKCSSNSLQVKMTLSSQHPVCHWFESKWAVGVYVSMNDCFSLHVCPVLNRWPVKGSGDLNPLLTPWLPSWFRFDKVLEKFFRGFNPNWHDSITKLLEICQLRIHDPQPRLHQFHFHQGRRWRFESFLWECPELTNAILNQTSTSKFRFELLFQHIWEINYPVSSF